MRVGLLVWFMSFILTINSYGQTSNSKKNYALIKAAENGEAEKVTQILSQKADVDFRDASGGTALFYATQNHHIEVVRILVYNKANMDLYLYGGFTPLMSACVTGDFEIAEYLVRNGAKIEEKDEYWATALHYAVIYADFYITDMLLFYGANRKATTYENTNVLMLAALNSDTSIAQLFINDTSLVNQVDKNGNSALSIAIQNNDSVFLDYLLEHGAKPQIVKKDNFQPYAWALANENTYAFEIIKPKHPGLEAVQNRKWNPLNIAQLKNEKAIAKSLKKEGYQNGILPFYTAFLNEATISFNNKDLFFNFGMGVQDSKYKTQLWLNYGTRFSRKAVLYQLEDGDMYQLWEHRRYFDLALHKYFYIPLKNVNLKPYFALSVQWVFGYYDGMSRELEQKPFIWVPQAGLQIEMGHIYFTIAYEYTPYDLYEISPHKIKLGVGYQINFMPKQKPYELLWL